MTIDLILLPGYAHPAPDVDARAWRVHLVGWISEPAGADSSRAAASVSLAWRLVGERQRARMDRTLFAERALLFLGDEVAGEHVEVELAGHSFRLGPSRADGRFAGAVTLVGGELPEIELDRSFALPVTARVAGTARSSRVHLVPTRGRSVVSDIDDTIKETGVFSRTETIVSTLGRPFVAVEGMASLYRRWAAEGATFHYVSASPWQLAGELERFLAEHGFPPGSMHLRAMRLADLSALDLVLGSGRSKRRHLAALLAHLPERRFYCVGDSGEKDLHIYTEAARESGGRIERILIRRLPCRFDPELVEAGVVFDEFLSAPET